MEVIHLVVAQSCFYYFRSWNTAEISVRKKKSVKHERKSDKSEAVVYSFQEVSRFARRVICLIIHEDSC